MRDLFFVHFFHRVRQFDPRDRRRAPRFFLPGPRETLESIQEDEDVDSVVATSFHIASNENIGTGTSDPGCNLEV